MVILRERLPHSEEGITHPNQFLEGKLYRVSIQEDRRVDIDIKLSRIVDGSVKQRVCRLKIVASKQGKPHIVLQTRITERTNLLLEDGLFISVHKTSPGHL